MSFAKVWILFHPGEKGFLGWHFAFHPFKGRIRFRSMRIIHPRPFEAETCSRRFEHWANDGSVSTPPFQQWILLKDGGWSRASIDSFLFEEHRFVIYHANGIFNMIVALDRVAWFDVDELQRYWIAANRIRKFIKSSK